MNKKEALHYALALSLGAFVLVGCSGDKKDAHAGGMHAMPPLHVTTYTVKAENIPVSLEYPAKVKSMQQVNVVARVSGILEKKSFTGGKFC
jgi:membrane fusion protein, multidrug efflux system